MKIPGLCGFFLALLIGPRTLFASSLPVELYNLDFTAPEVGTYGTSGSVSTQSSVGPFTDALLFQATTDGGRLDLPVGPAGQRFNLQYDMLVHNVLNSQYAFTMYISAGTARSVSLHGLLNYIYVFQSIPYTQVNAGGFLNDRVYHFDIDIELDASSWSLAVDGSQRFSSSVDGTILHSIAFRFSPWYSGAPDAPGVYGALDNVVITVPEPSAFGLFGLGTFIATLQRRRRFGRALQSISVDGASSTVAPNQARGAKTSKAQERPR